MGNRSLGIIALAIWAIASGLLSITNLSIEFAPVILALLLIASGILLLLGR